MAEVVPVVSESLEAQVRNLLPSQSGFGQDLQASNVIVPIIDLTAAAEGTTTPEFMQRALSFGSSTAFSVTNTTTVIINTTGFYQITYVSTIQYSSGGEVFNQFNFSDGLSTKAVWKHTGGPVGAASNNSAFGDLIVFLRSGDSVSAQSSATQSRIAGSYRQVADVNGNLVYPVGYTPQ